MLFSKVLNAPLKFPCNIESTALLAPVDCAKLIAVPASIAEILNDFLALRRGALRLGAMPIQPTVVYLRLNCLRALDKASSTVRQSAHTGSSFTIVLTVLSLHDVHQ
jgi:hypothetical protein